MRQHQPNGQQHNMLPLLLLLYYTVNDGLAAICSRVPLLLLYGENKKEHRFLTRHTQKNTLQQQQCLARGKPPSALGFFWWHSTQHATVSAQQPRSPPPGSQKGPPKTVNAASISKKQTTTPVRTHFQKQISISIYSFMWTPAPR